LGKVDIDVLNCFFI